MAYCSATDIKNRLSVAGLAWMADDDYDGVVSSAETAIATTMSIEFAGAMINAKLALLFDTIPPAGAESSTLLKHIAIELAVHHLATRKGQQPTQAMIDSAQQAMQLLDAIVAGQIAIPDVTYPGEGYDEEIRELGRPMAANPGESPVAGQIIFPAVNGPGYHAHRRNCRR